MSEQTGEKGILTAADKEAIRAALAHPLENRPWREWLTAVLDSHDAIEQAYADLLSRLGCIAEATYWDRPYDTRMDAIRGMCDLARATSTAPTPEADR
jgi:hypothetical protein